MPKKLTEYQKLLKSIKWKEKRLKVLKRDKNKCTKCENTKYLQVHHLYYIFGKLPWEYPLSALITLCRKCHKLAHLGVKIPWKKPKKKT